MATLSLLVLVATVVVLSVAQAQDNALLDEVEKRLLLVLENNGLSGLTVAANTVDQSLLPPREVVEFAIWRNVMDDRLLLAETLDGITAVMRQDRMKTAVLGDRTYVLRWPDVATVSADWDVPYRDVSLAIALRTPSTQMQMARLIVALLCITGAVFLIAMVLVNMNHQRRYARGLAEINQTLDLFAQGQTDARVQTDRFAPEIERLAALLNDALSRIDRLTNGIRYMSAHLAHEINTPLQKIRVITSRLSNQQTPDERKNSMAEIDRTLETAHARQQNLMQLFRLEAGEVANLQDRFDLGCLIETVFEDFEDILRRGERSVVLDVAQGVETLGNRPLFELVVSNILVNAAKYAALDSHILVTLEADAEKFRFIVSNSGSAFPETVRSGSFRRFVRAEDGRGPAGAGLGLNLIFAICEAHGFSVTLPYDPDKAIIKIVGTVTPRPGAIE